MVLKAIHVLAKWLFITGGCSFQATGLAVSLVAIYGYKSLTNKGAEKLSIFERMASVESGH